MTLGCDEHGWTWMNLQWDMKPSSSLEITQKNINQIWPDTFYEFNLCNAPIYTPSSISPILWDPLYMNKSKTLLVFLGFYRFLGKRFCHYLDVYPSWQVAYNSYLTWDVPYMPEDCLRDPKNDRCFFPNYVADHDYLTVSRCPTVQLLGGRRRPTFLCILKAELLESWGSWLPQGAGAWFFVWIRGWIGNPSFT